MIKRLTRTGNSLALVLDRAILELVRIDADTPVEISTDNGQRLIITPVTDPKRRERFVAAVERSNRKHAKTYKRLAGVMGTPTFLTVDEVIEIHADQIARYGGSPGVRDRGLLESAVDAPAASFEGRYFHADLFEMAAAYLFHLVKNHAFVDGNKRVGAAAADVFLQLNGWDPDADEPAFGDLVLAVATGATDKDAVAAFLRRHSKPLP